MKEDKKKERLAALFGMTVPEKPKPMDIVAEQNKSREAEAAISYLEEPKRFITRNCKICGGRFAVDRFNIACCSDSCREKDLLNYGIVWKPTRPVAERWQFQTGGPEPLVVSPSVLPMLIATRQEIEVKNQPPAQSEKSVDELLAELDLEV